MPEEIKEEIKEETNTAGKQEETQITKEAEATKEPKKKGPVRKFFKSFVDVKRWMAYDEVSGNVKTTFGLYRRLFTKSAKPVYHETYEESIARQNLTEAQLTTRKKAFLYSALSYFVFALCLFLYFVQLLLNKHLFAAFFDLILVGVLTLLAYHEHFWYMQMQKRKLGCNFHDWISFILRGAK
jgi:hypothetical protein